VSPATFFRWLDFSLHFPEGVVGSPRTASPEIGHAIVDAAAERIVDVADRLHASAGAGV
jgi:creatinine amidohydrolase/Fe(II)-dependent formamide hydrolase-like protein